MPKSPPETLREGAALYEERNKTYGDNYKKFGPWASLLLEGVSPKTAEDWNRMGVLLQIMSKLSRYVENFHKGGHEDSIEDMMVYAAMLNELDQDAKDTACSDLGF